MNPDNSQPELEKPGAGLPFPERLIVRYVLGPVLSRSTSWEKSLEAFKTEGARILKLTEGLSNAALTERVLVPSLNGIEDSSRFWSIAMTMEHLMIVGQAMAIVTEKLGNNEVPDVVADTARVKPSIQTNGVAVRARFSEFAARHGEAVLAGIQNRKSRTKHLHPWFGPFTARQWFWVMGVHQGVHRRQIQAILRAGSIRQQG